MSTNENENAQPDLSEPGDEAAEVEVIAHSDEQTEEPPNCFGVHHEN